MDHKTFKLLASVADADTDTDTQERALNKLTMEELSDLDRIICGISTYSISDIVIKREKDKKAKKSWLLRLADKLDGSGFYEKAGPVPSKNFDMQYFFDPEKDRIGKGKKPGCGFAACAGGWCGLDPFFKKRGFVTFIPEDEMDSETVVFTDPKTGERFEGLDALREFFQISDKAADHLFDSSDDNLGKSPKQIAAKIRKFVANIDKMAA